MSRLQDVRTIMAASLKSVAGLTCSNTVPAVINPPCAILKPVSGNWDTTLPRQAPMDKYELTVILPAASSPEEAQRNMDALLETAGTIKTAIESANYAGKINYARVTGWRNYGDAVMLGETAYLGVVFDIITY
jgi:hypothetical protein